MKDKCDCGTPLDMIKGNGYTFVACPKGHYERHEATGDKLKESDWAKDVFGWVPAPEPATLTRPRNGSIADNMVNNTVSWAEEQLRELARNHPSADLRNESWINAQAEFQKLPTTAGVLEIKDAIEKYKQRVNVYLSKWRKKLQSGKS